MIRCRWAARVALAVIVVVSSVAATSAIELVLLGPQGPARVRMQITFGEKSLDAVWEENFAALVAFFDRDGDGVLNEAEAARLPSVSAMREVLSLGFLVRLGTAPPFAELDPDASGKVDETELGCWYRAEGLGAPLVGAGVMSRTLALNLALVNMLDVNQDGIVQETELKNASAALARFDRNEDELIGAGELVAGLRYPGGAGSHLRRVPRGDDAQASSFAKSFPALVLPASSTDMAWTKMLQALPGGQQIKESDLGGWRSRKPEFEIQLGWDVLTWDDAPPTSPTMVLAGSSSASQRSLSLGLPGLLLVVRGDAGKLPESVSEYYQRLGTRFGVDDANDDQQLDAGEIEKAESSLWPSILASADRNDDGKLAEIELQSWLALQRRLAEGQVLLTLLDGGQGLLELLDGDHDGGLSLRELKSAAHVVTAAGGISNDRLDLASLPHTFLITASRGYPQSVLGVNERTGPAWFLAMDRNQDGEVSQREFTGPPAAFERLDADGNQRLTAVEVSK